MNCLYISRYDLYGYTPQNNRIGTIECPDQKRFWTCGIKPPETFIIETYKFYKYIFFIDYAELGSLILWDLAGEKVDIIVRGCEQENKTDVLYDIGTDFNLNITVFFSETMEEYLKS
jgi:hypothetical protein